MVAVDVFDGPDGSYQGVAYVSREDYEDECAADEAERRGRAAAHARLLSEGIEAFRLTREYVGEDMLPAVEGWSWFDWCEKANQHLLPVDEVNVSRLYATTNAQVWAEEFAKVCPDVDEGLMIGWFANAIETGRAAGRPQ
jgi:hypothetical protein